MRRGRAASRWGDRCRGVRALVGVDPDSHEVVSDPCPTNESHGSAGRLPEPANETAALLSQTAVRSPVGRQTPGESQPEGGRRIHEPTGPATYRTLRASTHLTRRITYKSAVQALEPRHPATGDGRDRGHLGVMCFEPSRGSVLVPEPGSDDTGTTRCVRVVGCLVATSVLSVISDVGNALVLIIRLDLSNPMPLPISRRVNWRVASGAVLHAGSVPGCEVSLQSLPSDADECGPGQVL